MVRSIKGVAASVSGSSCANLLWMPGGEEGDGTEAALQELAGRLEPWYLLGDNPTDRLSDLTPSFHSQLYIIHRKAEVWEVWELYDAGGERVKSLVATWWPANLTSSLVEAERWVRPLLSFPSILLDFCSINYLNLLGGRGGQTLEASP